MFKNSKSRLLEQLEQDIAITLCELENIFPNAFCDVKVHLPIHLAQEALVAGSVQYRWINLLKYGTN